MLCFLDTLLILLNALTEECCRRTKYGLKKARQTLRQKHSAQEAHGWNIQDLHLQVRWQRAQSNSFRSIGFPLQILAPSTVSWEKQLKHQIWQWCHVFACWDGLLLQTIDAGSFCAICTLKAAQMTWERSDKVCDCSWSCTSLRCIADVEC